MASFNIVDGVGKVYYAVLNNMTETYGDVKLLSDKVVEFGLSPTQSETVVSGSNREVMRLVGQLVGEITLTVQSLESEVAAELLGRQKALEGGYIDKGLGRPYVAIMVEKSLDGDEMEYLTVYRGQFKHMEEKAKTKTDKDVELQPLQLTGSFSQLSNDLFKWGVRSTDVGFDKIEWATKWGKEVIKPTDAPKAPVTP